MAKRTSPGGSSASGVGRLAGAGPAAAGGSAGEPVRSNSTGLSAAGPVQSNSVSPRGNKPFQRSMNRALVLNDLRRAPGASRAELADRLALDRSTISNITGELIDAGLIEELATGPRMPSENDPPAARAGRRAVGLRVTDERLCALGIEIDAEGYRAVVRDNSGSIRYREAGRCDFVTDTAAEIAATVGSVASRAGDHGVPVIGAGCAIPGYISPADARIVHSRELGVVDTQLHGRAHVGSGRGEPRAAYDDVAAGRRRSTGYGIPIVYDNDANCCAWGELHAGRMNEHEDDLLFVLAKVGAEHLGIGLGIAADGTVRSGATHSAGELYSSGWRGDERTQLSIAAHDLSGIRENADVRRAFLIELLSSLIPVLSVVDPASVVFGGVLRDYFEEVACLVAGELSAGYLARVVSRMRRSLLAEDEMAAGAAALVLEHLFRIPRYGEEATSIRWEDVARTLTEAV